MITVECNILGFELNVTGSEVSVLEINIQYDGTNQKFGARPLLIDTYWIVQSPSPCYHTLPSGYDFLKRASWPGFDWEFGNFWTPVGLVTLEERSTLSIRLVELQVFVYSAKNPKEITFQCGAVVLDTK